ncbi:type II secretion system GspH family protein [Patescibacteria group bacterium]|nr:type II secretion system GspH family protein [Patescibacteria group bacterium]
MAHTLKPIYPIGGEDDMRRGPIKKIKNNIQKGFTLIELMLVVVLIAVSVGVTNDILMSLVRSNNKTQVMTEIEQQSNFVSSKIERELRNARSVTTPLAGAFGSSLVFETKDGTTIEYNVDTTSGLIKRKVNTGTLTNITSNNNPGGVVATCGSPSCFSVSGFNPQIVNVSIKFSQAQPGAGSSYSGQTTIQSTVVVRNTY